MFCDDLSSEYFRIVFSHLVIVSLWSRQGKWVSCKERKWGIESSCSWSKGRQVVNGPPGLYPQLAQLQELRGLVLSTPKYPHFWHHLQVQGVPRTTPWFDNLLTGPRTSLKAVMLTVTIYYRERIQVKISQRKRCIDPSREGFHLQSFPWPWDSLLPWHWCVIVHTEYCQPGELTQVSDFILKLRCTGMTDWLVTHMVELSSRSTDPNPPP